MTEAAVSGAGVIATVSIQFLKDSAFTTANLGLVMTLSYGPVISNSTIRVLVVLIITLSVAAIYGGADQDSVSVSGSLYGATVDFGAGNGNTYCWCY